MTEQFACFPKCLSWSGATDDDLQHVQIINICIQQLHNNGFGLLLVHTDRKDDTAATGNAKCIKLHLCN